MTARKVGGGRPRLGPTSPVAFGGGRPHRVTPPVSLGIDAPSFGGHRPSFRWWCARCGGGRGAVLREIRDVCVDGRIFGEVCMGKGGFGDFRIRIDFFKKIKIGLEHDRTVNEA